MAAYVVCLAALVSTAHAVSVCMDANVGQLQTSSSHRVSPSSSYSPPSSVGHSSGLLLDGLWPLSGDIGQHFDPDSWPGSTNQWPLIQETTSRTVQGNFGVPQLAWRGIHERHHLCTRSHYGQLEMRGQTQLDEGELIRGGRGGGGWCCVTHVGHYSLDSKQGLNDSEQETKDSEELVLKKMDWRSVNLPYQLP